MCVPLWRIGVPNIVAYFCGAGGGGNIAVYLYGAGGLKISLCTSAALGGGGNIAVYLFCRWGLENILVYPCDASGSLPLGLAICQPPRSSHGSNFHYTIGSKLTQDRSSLQEIRTPKLTLSGNKQKRTRKQERQPNSKRTNE